MTAKIARLHNNYDRLENQERLHLVASAIERGDDDELNALISTTPKKSYVMRDAWMVDRYHAIRTVSLVYWLMTEETLREREKMLHHTTILESSVRLADEPKRLKVIELVGKMIEEHDNLLWAASEAIRQLATAVKLQPRELLVFVPEHVKGRLNLQRHTYDNQVDEAILQKMVKSYFKGFSVHWPDLDIPDESS